MFTGVLSISRAEAQKSSRDLEAKVTNSISTNTDYVVVGESAGSKLTQAKKLNISILTEEEWGKLTQNLAYL